MNYASLWSRFFALVIDSLILLIPSALIHVGVPIAGPLLLSFFYYPIFHASPLQATIGKKALGIRVTSVNGDTLSLQMSFIRYLVALASYCMLFAGHLVAFFTAKRQALHDLVADSVVVDGVNEGIGIFEAWVSTFRRLFGIGEVKKKKLDELERLYEMRKNGAITQEEYERLKKELI